MSIFGDIVDAAESAAGMAGETVKSAAKAVTAPVLVPAGVVWDIASSPSDWKKDLGQGAGSFVSDLSDPLTNTSTFSGALAAPVMQGIEHVYREEISEPTAAAIGDLDKAWQKHDIGVLFDDKNWDQSYKVAQNRSIGQAATLLLHNHASDIAGPLGLGIGAGWGKQQDPFKDDSYASMHEHSPFLTSLTSGTIDATVRWYADPGLLAGKAGGLAMEAAKLRPITEAERANVTALSESETGRKYGLGSFSFTPVKGLKTRYDALTGTIDNGVHAPGWLDGKGATQIYRGYDPLKSIDGGTQVADIFAQTSKIPNLADRINTRRTILRVLNGDHQTIADLEGSQKFIADQLVNVANGSITGAKANVVADDVFRNLAGKGLTPPTLPSSASPENIAEAERQIGNLPEVDAWLRDQETRLNTLLGTPDGGQPGFAGRLNGVSIPGAKAERAIGREEGKGILRGGEANTGHVGLNRILDGSLPHIVRPLDSLYQASPSAMPVRVIHAVAIKAPGKVLKGTAQAPVKLFDSFRNARPEGIVNTNDADDSFRQLDAFLRKAGASPEKRNELLDKLAASTDSASRARVLATAEAQAHALIFAKHNIDAPEEFLADLTRRGQANRSAILTSMQGRAYSATDSLDNNGFRVDQIDENGTPVSLPFLDTQDANLLPMIDINVLDHLAKRHQNVFRAAARSWREEENLYTPGVRSHAKRRGSQAIDLVGGASSGVADHMIALTDELNRAWKFSVLFRLGYPMRVLMDDHMRIGAAFGASTIINGIKTGFKDAALDLKGGALNRKAFLNLQVEHELLRAKIPSETVLASNREAYTRLAQIEKKLGKAPAAAEVDPIAARLATMKPGEELTDGLSAADAKRATAFKDAVRHWVSGKGTARGVHPRDMQDALVNVARKAPVVDVPLYRGSRDLNLKVGQVFDRDISSFSTDRRIGENFAIDNSGALYSVQGSPRALNLSNLGLGPEGEYLAGGRFKVVSVDEVTTDLGVKVKHYTIEPAEGIKSQSRRRELEAERDTLLDHHPEDLSEAADRMAVIEQSLKTGDYKAALRRMGDQGHYDADGNFIPGAFEGTHGETFRQINAANQTWDRLGQVAEGDIHNTLSKSGSFTTLRANEDTDRHLASWAYAINKHIRSSELASIIIKGGNADDVLEFLTKTPRGRELAAKMPYHGHDPERWAIDIERMVDDYLPTQELRDIAARRNVSAKELDGMFKDVAARPDVHGTVGATSELGNLSARLNHLYSSFYKFVGGKNDAMSRHPLFVSLYKDEMARQVPHRAAIARLQGRELTSADIEKVAHQSRLYAKKHVTRTLFEMGSTSEMAHFLRFVSPFFGAWQEGMDRWWRIVSKDPAVVRKFQLGFDAPRRLGLVVDQDGNPVKPGEGISDQHYILMQMPQAWGGKNPKDWQSQFKVSESSFNLIFQGGGLFNPGFGPVVQMPANELAKRNADNKELQQAIEAILPMGTRADALDMFSPNTFKYGWGYASAKFFGHHTAQYEIYQKQVLADRAVQWQQDHPDGRMTQTVLNQLIEGSQKDVLSLMAMRFVSAAASPASVQIQSKFTPQILAYRRLQDYAAAHNKDSRWVDDKFVKQWGEAFFPLMQSTSSNPAGVNQSAETVAAIKKNRDLMNVVDPSLYRMIISHSGEGAFSYTARNYLTTTALRPGSNETFIQTDNPRDALTNSTISQGWFDYNKITNKLMVAAHAQGLASYVDSDELMSRKRKAVQSLAAHNGAWWQDYNSFNPAEYDAKLEGMKQIASNPKLKSDSSRTDIFTLQQYLTLRNSVTAELRARAAAGGSASEQAQSNADLMGAFRKGVSALVESNTWFEEYMFNGTIEHDPYLTAATASAAPIAAPGAGTSGLVA